MERNKYRGIVRGKNIELDQAPPVPNGFEVTVEIQSRLADGDGVRKSAGSWADAGDDLDLWLEKLYKARRSKRGADRP
jgi:hypothetical protein